MERAATDETPSRRWLRARIDRLIGMDAEIAWRTAIEPLLYADARWVTVLAAASASLPPRERQALAALLPLIEPGPAPPCLPLDLVPDDEIRIADETAAMDFADVSLAGVVPPLVLGLGHPGIARVQGLFTALRRLVRNAKARHPARG